MAHSVFAKNNVAVITGGASGIGLAIARKCQQAGMKVAVVDNNAELLAQAKGVLNNDSDSAEAFQADVTDPSSMTDLLTRITDHFGSTINFLALNAGISVKGDYSDTTYFQKITAVNYFGVVNGLAAFLPHLQAQSSDVQSAIVITGSKQGITNPPGNPAYNASKAAVKTLAEHLSYDLRNTPNISVHLLVPGWTFTGLTGGGPASTKEKPEQAWAPEQVADYLAEKMAQGKFYVLCPDGAVTEDMDRQRMLYAVGDLVYGRQPLSRWREDTKEQAERDMKGMKW